MKWYFKAAENNNADALYILGSFYQYGVLKFNKDQMTSEMYYLRAANLGHEKAKEILIERFEKCIVPLTFDEREFLPFYAELAKNGDIDALIFLSMCKLIGLYVVKDEFKAFRKLFEIAEKGNSTAAYFVGFCYQYGVGTFQDKDEALGWYKKAAFGKDYDAIRSLAYRNDEYADEWASIAEDSVFKVHLGEEALEYQGRRSVQALIKYPEFYRFASEFDDVNACYLYGVSLSKHRYLVPTNEDPLVYYEKSVLINRHVQSAHEIYDYYLDRYDPCDADSIIYLVKDILAENGDVQLQYEMGIRYFFGDNVKRDINRGKHFLIMAADNKHRDAKNFCERYLK